MIRNKKYIYFFILVFLVGGFLFTAWFLFMPVALLRNPNLYYSDMLKKIDETNRIELWVNDNLKTPLKIIDTPSQIKATLEHFRANYTEGWQYNDFRPGTSLSDGRISIIFYKRNKSLGLIQIGKVDRPYFVYSLGPGRFLTGNEFKELMGLLEISEELIND